MVYAVNPRQAARYRERHGTSGAESDARDAHMLADMVRTDSHQLRAVAGGGQRPGAGGQGGGPCPSGPDLLPAWYAFRDTRARRRAVQWLADNSLIDDGAADHFLSGHPDPVLR